MYLCCNRSKPETVKYTVESTKATGIIGALVFNAILKLPALKSQT